MRLLFFIAALLLAEAARGDGKHPFERVTASTLSERLDAFSQLFLGREYADDSALGEGPTGEFDRNPLVRFDKFHCVTYLETVIALAVSKSIPDFEKNLQALRYRGARKTFEERNHFPCVDWIPNNVRHGFVEDITAEVAGENPVATAVAMIDRKGWYGFMTIDRIERPDLPLPKRLLLLDKLKERGKAMKKEKGQIKYIAFSTLFPHARLKASLPDENATGEADTAEQRALLAPANEALFQRIPSGVVFNVVRPNWNTKKLIGTHMNVSHQGFLFRRDGVLVIRHAKREPAHKVVEEPLLDYLRRAMLRKSIDGINLLRVREPGR